MVAVTPDVQAPAPSAVTANEVSDKGRTIGLVPSASMLTGAAIAVVWFWIPLALLIVAVSSIPSVVGFVLTGIVFVYLVRGAEWVERVRSEAVFGMGIPIPPRRMSQSEGFQGWAHQLWLDVSSARFWKGAAHHYLRMSYDALATAVALALLMFAFMGPAVATAINHSDAEAGLSFIPPALAWVFGVVAVAAAIAIAVSRPPSMPGSTVGCLGRRRPRRCSIK